MAAAPAQPVRTLEPDDPAKFEAVNLSNAAELEAAGECCCSSRTCGLSSNTMALITSKLWLNGLSSNMTALITSERWLHINVGRTVSITGLRKTFSTPDGEKVAVADLNLTMYEGQVKATNAGQRHVAAGQRQSSQRQFAVDIARSSCCSATTEPAKPQRSTCSPGCTSRRPGTR